MTRTRRSRKWLAKLSATDPVTGPALEILVLRWEACEMCLFALFTLLARLEPRQRRIIARDLGNVPFARRLLESARYRRETRRLPTLLLHEIRHALSVYHVCRQKQDALVHAATDTMLRRGRVRSRVKGPSMPSNLLPNDLNHIRLVTEESRALASHLRSIWTSIDAANTLTSAAAPRLKH